MKKLLVLLTVLVCCANVQAQNIEGQIIASQYGKWRVPGYAPNTYSSFAPSSCRVQGGASFFFAFTVGTPIAIVDANPALTETVMPTSTVDTNVSCAVTIAPINDHEVPFYLTSATGGLQEALNQNFTTPQTNTVILDSTFYELVGGAANAAAVIAAAQGSTQARPDGRNPGAHRLVPVERLPVCQGFHYRQRGQPEHPASRHRHEQSDQ